MDTHRVAAEERDNVDGESRDGHQQRVSLAVFAHVELVQDRHEEACRRMTVQLALEQETLPADGPWLTIGEDCAPEKAAAEQRDGRHEQLARLLYHALRERASRQQ